jgi:hypothetical protein
MDFSLTNLLRLARYTAVNPRDGAQQILDLNLPRDVLWKMLVLTVVISTLLTHVGVMLMPGTSLLMTEVIGSPVLTGLVQVGLLVLMVYCVYWIGRAMGGTAAFDDALAMVIWLQFIMVCVQVIQTALLPIAPMLAGLLGLASIVLFFWLLTHFVALIHGFKSLPSVFIIIIAAIFGVIFGLSLLLALISLSVPGGV